VLGLPPEAMLGVPCSRQCTVVALGESLVLATGDGALAVDELKSAGKRALPASEWLRGARVELGDRFGRTA